MKMFYVEGFWLYAITILLLLFGISVLLICGYVMLSIIKEDKKEKAKIERRKNYVQKR